MCIHKRYITNAIGQSVLVPCGHCEACLQSKAINRTNRIRNNVYETGSHVPLFVTLTYCNKCVPYIDLNELNSSPVYQDIDDDGVTHSYREVTVYRDTTVTWLRSSNGCNGNYRFHRVRKDECENLGTFECSVEIPKLKSLSNYDCNKVGVCFFRDVQLFIKRLKSYLYYRKYDKPFSYYQCSEYGPETCRPHFHLLIWVPLSDVRLWKAAISASWSFDDYHRTYRSVEVAKNAASYVSSYVNCDASVPDFLKRNAAFRPHHSYSQGFGVRLKSFTIQKVYEAFLCGDLRYNCSHFVNGTVVVDNLLLPKYVVGRYFPKFKGFSRLNANEIISVLLRPSSLINYAHRLNLTMSEYQSIAAMLWRKRLYALSNGISNIDYALAYSRIWSVRSSQVLRDLYDSIVLPSDNFLAYDNISDFYDGKVKSDSLFSCLSYLPPDFVFLRDFNKFPDNITRHNVLVRSYHDYSKDKKIRNKVYNFKYHM